MKEVIVYPAESDTAACKTKIISRDIPVPAAGQVLIKNVVAGTNPKDWKVPCVFGGPPQNSGDDVAGTIAAVGAGVTEFKIGDRVAAFHEMTKPDGAFAEYTIAWAHTTFHIPERTSYEEAATIPLAAMTAAIGMYLCLPLPEPWKDNQKKIPLVIYGGASAVGAFAIKFARKSNIHPIIAVAGRGKDFVESLIDRSKGDTIVDYRDGDDAVVNGIEQAVKQSGESLYYAFDAVSEKGSYHNLAKILQKNVSGSKIVLVLPGKDYSSIPSNVEHTLSMVGRVHSAVGKEDPEFGKEFGYLFYRYMSLGLEKGWFSGHPYEVIPGGLNGVEEGLKRLKSGKASAVKYVYRIAETPK
ncbi:hypothetical protein HDU85_005631 [Gaertneriomyces sp. JEL0708]|nr:hypothetical protein HDU85_005631 [Gaertneriomyces sp. JEL0708]